MTKDNCPEMCTEHSGLTADVRNVKKDMKDMKSDIRYIRDKLLGRPPLWVTPLFAVMAAFIGYLAK